MRRDTLIGRYGDQLGAIVGRRQAEAALIAARQEAERAADLARSALVEAQAANRAKTEFLANMSHELRTPLNAIIGFSDMIRRGILGRDQARKYLEYAKDINDSGTHLLDLINDILDLAKVEAGQLALHEEVVDVGRVVRSCMTIITERAQKGGLALSHHLATPAVRLWVDERKLKQILINLLSNAVKFTPEGGRVTLSARLDEDGTFLAEIADTGIGIAEEDMWKAMAPFRQVDSRMSRSYEGTGLGLPLTKALVELHGGTLAIRSRVGEGTQVTVRLPAERVQPALAVAVGADHG
jgi:signal transduction histidine kinase